MRNRQIRGIDKASRFRRLTCGEIIKSSGFGGEIWSCRRGIEAKESEACV